MRTLLFLAVLLVLGGFALVKAGPWLFGYVVSSAVEKVAERPDPVLERMVGKDTADRLRANAARLARISGAAFACGLRDRKWLDDLALASLNEAMERTGGAAADPPMAAAARV